MALLKFIGGIRLRAALVKCGITLAVALLDLTAGVILTAKKVAIRAWEAHSDSCCKVVRIAILLYDSTTLRSKLTPMIL